MPHEGRIAPRKASSNPETKNPASALRAPAELECALLQRRSLDWESYIACSSSGFFRRFAQLHFDVHRTARREKSSGPSYRRAACAHIARVNASDSVTGLPSMAVMKSPPTPSRLIADTHHIVDSHAVRPCSAAVPRCTS